MNVVRGQEHDIFTGPVHSVYNPSFSACFFNQNSIFLSQQISQQCFSAGLSEQPGNCDVVSGPGGLP
jgi:hypothetical protein